MEITGVSKVFLKRVFLIAVMLACCFQAFAAQEMSASDTLFFSLTRKALQNNDFSLALNYVQKIRESYADEQAFADLEKSLKDLNNSYFVDASLKARVLEALDTIEKQYMSGSEIQPQQESPQSAVVSLSQEQSKKSLEKPILPSLQSQPQDLIEPPKSWTKRFRERLMGKEYLFYLNKNRPIDERIREEEGRIESFEVYLDERLWATQPKTEIPIKIRQPVIIHANNVKRFLSTRPELLSLKKLDANTLEITTETYAAVPVYIWDDQGRWTIDFKGFSRSSLYRQLNEQNAELSEIQNEETFKFKYAVDGNYRMSGTNFSGISKDSNRILQFLSIEGPSPYGVVDSEARWRYENNLDGFTYYTLGLSDGDLGRFNKFNLRLVDYAIAESSYTFGYSGLRGIYLDKLFLKDYFRWTGFYGKERETTLQAVSDSMDRDVEYQGTKLDFLDKHNGRYTLNYIERGGNEFIPEATDRAYGFDFVKAIGRVGINGEISTDSEDFAKVLGFNYLNTRRSIGAQFYEIDEEYNGIAGPVGDRGRLGVRLNGFLSDWHKFDFNGVSNIYQERALSLPGYEEELNYENYMNARYAFTESLNLSSSVYYDHLGGTIEPSRYFNMTHSLNKNLNLFDKDTNAYVSAGYIQNRNDIDPSSDYKRYIFGSGFEMKLTPHLVWSSSYQYNIQDDLGVGFDSQPSSLTTGFSYRKKVTDRLKWDGRLSFRKELSSSDSPNFFEASDRLSLSGGLRYKPAPEMETYVSADLDQDINDSRGADDTDLSIRWGMEANWDSGLSWNPKGVIEGVVYKDLNQNQRQDVNEPGVSGLLVRVGNREITTDDLGRFATLMRAKKVKVVLKNENFPKGYNYSDSFSKNIDVGHNQVHTVFFPIAINTSVIGYVFLDENSNGLLDKDEQSFPNVRITLDGDAQETDYQGAFLFSSLEGGEHKLRIDVNSIPADFIPKVKIQQMINIVEGETTTINIPLVSNIKK